MPLPQLLEGIEDNLATCFTWGPSHAAGMRVHSDATYTLVDSGLPSIGLNAACRVHPPLRSLPEWVAKVPLWFGPSPVPFSWWISPTSQSAELHEALCGANFELQSSRVAMRVSLELLPAPDHPPLWLAVRRVESLADLEAYAALRAVNSFPPDFWLNEYFSLTASHLLSPASPIHFYVGYLDGVPAATAAIVVTRELAGLYGVTTLEVHRRQGIGTAMALAALRASRDHGCSSGVLLTPNEHLEWCRRCGFTEVGTFQRYALKPTVWL